MKKILNKKEAFAYFNEKFLDFLLKCNFEGNLKSDGSGKIRCLHPDHEDKNPSMGFYKHGNKLHCFSCGQNMGVLDVVGVIYKIKDREGQFKKASEIFGVEVVGESFHDIHREGKPMGVEAEKFGEKSVDYSDFIKEAAANIGDEHFREYLRSRGIFQSETVKKFRLGYVESYAFYDSNLKRNVYCRALIIPYSNKAICCRRIDDTDNEVSRYTKRGSVNFLNIEAIDSNAEIVVICEGEFDAMSVYEAGHSCGVEGVSLGSVNNVDKFLNFLEERLKRGSLDVIFDIELDSDAAGETARDKLAVGLANMGLQFVKDIGLKGSFKDLNERFVNERQKFIKTLENMKSLVNEKLKEEQEKHLEDFKKKYCAATSFDSYVEWLKSIRATPMVKTGFRNFDKCFGGLNPGLYVIGGMPGAGKTAFLLQIADNLSLSGVPVICFPLEMSQNELITRSLSRLSYLKVVGDEKFDRTYVLTYDDIIKRKDASNPIDENEERKKFFEECVRLYRDDYAPNLYFVRDENRMSLDSIFKIVEEFLCVENKVPVIIIDYLQILKQCNEHSSAKDSIDENITKLKNFSAKHNLPVLMASSLNRDSYGRNSLASYKESGGIEYGVDVAITLSQKDNEKTGVNQYFRMNAIDWYRRINLTILKNRNGVSQNTINFNYYPQFHFFEEESGVELNDYRKKY